MSTDIVHNDGSVTNLLTSETWDALAALDMHILQEPVDLLSTDALRAKCVFDSSDRSTPTLLGTGLVDEMCFSYVVDRLFVPYFHPSIRALFLRLCGYLQEN